MQNKKVFNLKVLGDKRGSLIALENSVDIPFNFQRVFYIYATQNGITRGNHAHYKTNQFLVAVNGSCKVTLDDGKDKKTFTLNKPNIGLLQSAMIWGIMHDFTQDCVLMVLADKLYEPTDYINDYENFLNIVEQN